MDKIEVMILDQHERPDGMMLFLARLTQRGHNVSTMADLAKEYWLSHETASAKPELIQDIAALPHGTIKRFTPITVAVVGASRRFLAQIRTHQVGFTFVSASQQYSNYTSKAKFVVPYSIMEADNGAEAEYLLGCQEGLRVYEELIKYRGISHDDAAYVMPQGLRNILIIQGNHQAWEYLISLRACRRNTNETRYVVTRIWAELLKSNYGQELFGHIGPPCRMDKCREGKMACESGLFRLDPERILKQDWPLIHKEE